MANDLNALQISLPPWIAAETASEWDAPIVNGYVLPGVAILEKLPLVERVDAPKASGKEGGDTKLKGLEMPKFSITMYLRFGDEYAQFLTIEPMLLPRKLVDATAILQISHPMLLASQINAFVVIGFEKTAPQQGRAMVIRIDCLACSPEKSSTTKNVSAKGINGNAAQKKKVPQNQPGLHSGLGNGLSNSIKEQTKKLPSRQVK